MYILLYTRLLLCLCWLLLVMSLSNFFGLFSSLLYQVSKRHLAAFHFLCIVIYLLPSIQTLTNIAYMFGVALVIDIRWCFMHTKIIKIFPFFCDSVVFFLILHSVFASLAGHFYQINWTTFVFSLWILPKGKLRVKCSVVKIFFRLPQYRSWK